MIWRFLHFLLLVMLLFGCSQKPMVLKRDNIWPNGTTYEIFVQSFADSNGDGIGDIPGMTSKLDYLKDLGVQAIWLMPIHPSPSYHKYDVTDYNNIHPDYGSREDFRTFIQQAHKRNIKVIMDLVVNHTSWEHPWFKDAVSGKNARYRNYYVWRNIDEVRDELEKKRLTLDSDNLSQWHPSEGNEEYYYGFFYKGMPDLNFDNPNVRQEIIAVGRYWLEEFNIDGYRLDAAGHIYPRDRAADSHSWWIEFGDAMRSVNPDVYLVGEEWGTTAEIAPYLKGLRSMFNFNLFFDLNKVLVDEIDSGLIDQLINARSIYRSKEPEFTDAIFINNHDRNRIINMVNGNVSRAQLALAIIQTLPGMVYIYYGDEIGMLGQKPDEYIREPFLWDKANKAPEQTHWLKPMYSTYEKVIPLAKQLENPGSTYQFFKWWINVRNSDEILRNGRLLNLESKPEILSFVREYNDNRVAVYHNLSGQEQHIELVETGFLHIKYARDTRISISNGVLNIPSYASVVLD